jgi:hypothetical protein
MTDEEAEAEFDRIVNNTFFVAPSSSVTDPPSHAKSETPTAPPSYGENPFFRPPEAQAPTNHVAAESNAAASPDPSTKRSICTITSTGERCPALEGVIGKAIDVSHGGTPKVLFHVGQYTCKAFSASALDKLGKLEGQRTAMTGYWIRNPQTNAEEFVAHAILPEITYPSPPAPETPLRDDPF